MAPGRRGLGRLVLAFALDQPLTTVGSITNVPPLQTEVRR